MDIDTQFDRYTFCGDCREGRWNIGTWFFKIYNRQNRISKGRHESKKKKKSLIISLR